MRPSGFFYSLLSENEPEEGERTFIDRDGFLFSYVLLYLRTGDFSIEDHHLGNLKREADFYQLPNMSAKIGFMIDEAAKQKNVSINLSKKKNSKTFRILVSIVRLLTVVEFTEE